LEPLPKTAFMKEKSDLRKWLLKAHDQADSGKLQVTHELPARMPGSRRSTASLAASVLKNQSQPLRLKNRTVIALLVASNVLGNFSLSSGLHEVGRWFLFLPGPTSTRL
jgi:hypothetical protein